MLALPPFLSSSNFLNADVSTPSFLKNYLTFSLISALSLIYWLMISLAPYKISSSENSFNNSLGSSILSIPFYSLISVATGKNPFSIAISAFVFFFRLKGSYKSSTCVKVSALIIFCLSSSVNLPYSWIFFIAVILAFWIFSNDFRISWIYLNYVSSKLPVTSLRYLAIKWVVFSWSYKFIAF